MNPEKIVTTSVQAQVIPLRRPGRERPPVPPVAKPVEAPVVTLPTKPLAPAVEPDTLTRVLTFLRNRLTGEYSVDDFGFDPELTDTVLLPPLRLLYEKWFRVSAHGVENLPSAGGALVVCNHSGTLPLDAVMTAVAVHDEHPARRHLRMLGADLVF